MNPGRAIRRSEANGLLTLIATTWDGHYTLTPSDHARIDALNIAMQSL